MLHTLILLFFAVLFNLQNDRNDSAKIIETAIKIEALF